MERLKHVVTQIAITPDCRLSELPLLHRSLLPLLSLASSIYRFSLFLRRRLYFSGLVHQRRLPVPVISVGNLTWGGNGKTPMVEFIARLLDEAGIGPLILTRGYSGGDEAKMLHRHLLQTSARIGVGANRIATAASMFERHGYVNSCDTLSEKLSSPYKSVSGPKDERIGVVILDDGMQHWRVLHDVEIVMLNGLMPWGNNHLLPRGPLRESPSALVRADIVVIHHADLVPDTQLRMIESTVHNIDATLPVFHSRMAPSHFFEVKNPHSRLSPRTVQNMVVLCVSAIGFPNAFAQAISKIGPLHVDRLDFSDHHLIQADDIEMITERLGRLKHEFNVEAIVVVTEKDYDRDPVILKQLCCLKVLVLCSSLQIMPLSAWTKENFRMNLKKHLIDSLQEMNKK
ncbi:probable tetraacyldisaccharide 4'-kinase, mitochondrial isoform X4 [Elaeis guineensis]|uniref:tetraacyldisaccharide 4'-kinase n=1 Tax=Elaeis guineensis var. tenera TaxID=51953 RepID=A0A6I9RCW3_ELAGV|nr:probable tetraacyldisaccharide 4'-kinase, mitochondrial isoform X2 [Elaeis guineensis]